MRPQEYVFQIAKKHVKPIVALVIAQMGSGLCSVLLTLVLRSLIDGAVSRRLAFFYENLLYFIMVTVTDIALCAAVRYFQESTKVQMENEIKRDLLSHLLYADYESVTSIHSGEWMNRMTSDAIVVAEGITQILPEVFGMGIRIVGACAIFAVLLPQLFVIVLPGSIAMSGLIMLLRKRMKKLHRDVQEKDGKYRIFISERLANLLIIKTFTREKEEIRKADDLLETYKMARQRKANYNNLCNTGFSIVMHAAYVACIAYCGFGIIRGHLSYGTLVAIMQIVGMIQGPIVNVSGYTTKYYAMIASAERMIEVYEYPVEHAKEAEVEFQGLQLHNVSFSYKKKPDQYILQNLSMQIDKSSFTAVIGPSGCGKSTLFKLLLGVYRADAGTCEVLTTTGSNLLTPEYRRLFAYVPQGNQLMHGTIREVIAFDDPEKMKQEDQIFQALQISDAMNFVTALPEGIDYVLGEKGSGLSEGQLQRLAIARAVMQNRKVLLLDEATSALDLETEQRVLANIRKLTDLTVIFITHRNNTEEFCDQVIHMVDEGSVEHE